MLADHWPSLRPPSLTIAANIGTLPLPLPDSLHTLGWNFDSNYKIRHDPPPWAEYLIEYSPPHSPTGELDPPTADQSLAPGRLCTPRTRTLLRDPSLPSGVPTHRPSPYGETRGAGTSRRKPTRSGGIIIGTTFLFGPYKNPKP